MSRTPFLTDAQLAQVQAEYIGRRGQRQELAARFGVSARCIGYWVARLGLVAHPHTKTKDALTDECRLYLLAHYTGKRGQTQVLAQKFGVGYWTMKHWIQRLGLSRSERHIHWTDEERDYLRRHITRMSFSEIALRMGRTLQSVRGEAHELGLHKRDEGYTLLDLTMGFRCQPKKVREWIAAGWLQGKRRKTARAVGDMWLFTEQSLIRFLRQYPQAIADLSFDYIWVHDLLVGGRRGVGSLAGTRQESEAASGD